jgi:hypothetical protein
MGIGKFLFKTGFYASVPVAAGTGTALFLTRKAEVKGLDKSDPVFSTASYIKFNPNKNPGVEDYVVRKIAINRIKPELLEGAEQGKLVQALTQGVWGNIGKYHWAFVALYVDANMTTAFAFQRWYLEQKYFGPETASQLWKTADIQRSTYPVGTYLVDHFEVVEKSPDTVTFRCGESPRVRDVRPSDGLFQIVAKVNRDEGFVELGVKSVLFQGLGKATGAPMPFVIIKLHELYAKMLLESGLQNVKK